MLLRRLLGRSTFVGGHLKSSRLLCTKEPSDVAAQGETLPERRKPGKKRTFLHRPSEVDDYGGKILATWCGDMENSLMEADVVIVGGGVIGSAIAFFLKHLCRQVKVVVVEQDPSYRHSSSALSVGGLRQQFSVPENIEMSLFGAEFLRNIDYHLGIRGCPPVELHYYPHGYLTLARQENAELLRANSDLQNSLGAKNAVLSAAKLRKLFPWLNVDDIECGCLGLAHEGWFDPWQLLCAFKRKALSLGTEYVTGRAIDFTYERMADSYVDTADGFANCDRLKELVVEDPQGNRTAIKFSRCVIAAGAFSAEIARKAQVGEGEGILAVPLPVEPRKRYVYCFHSPEGPGLNTPLTIDPSGTYFRRNGLANHYICGRSPEPDEEPPVDDLQVDEEYFLNRVWPQLANRVKAFENLKVISSWAGFYEYNTFDANGIIGAHPFHANLYFATGFSGHGIQQAPAVGKVMSELIYEQKSETLDLSRLAFDRIMRRQPLRENNVV